MYNKDLFEISDKAVKSINTKDVEKRNKELEKEVLEVIKKHSKLIDENGISTISVRSRKNAYDYNEEYTVLRKIIETGKQRYYEEEYCLYFIKDVNITVYSSACSVINFVWNALEYNEKHKDKVKTK